MAVEVHGCADDPGSEIVGAGCAEAAVVVQSSEVFDDPVGWVGEDVVADGEPSSFDEVIVGAAAVSGEDVVDVLLSSSLSKLDSGRPQGVVDGGPLGARCDPVGQLVEVVDLCLGLSNGVVGGGFLVECGQGALLTRWWGRSGTSHGVEYGLDWGRFGGRPVGQSRLGGDQCVELFEFDDVGPVGDDPVAPFLLGVDCGDEVVVDFR